jgi:hypothetical protein
VTLNNIPDLDRARQAFFGDTAAELDTLTDAAANGVTAATLIAGATAGAGGTGVTAAVTVGDTSASVQTANHTALAAAVTAAIAAGHNTVSLPPGDISFNSTLALTAPIRFVGSSLGPKPDGFTQSNLCYTGTGEAIKLGTDNGQASDTSPAYDGPGEGCEFLNVSLSYTGSATSNLANGAGTYGTGTYGIRDYRGGRLRLEGSSITGFEYGIWGVLSDENKISGGKIKRCKTGLFVGTRSDQLNLQSTEFFKNDRAIEFDGAQGARCFDVHFVDNGSGSTCAIKIDSSNTRRPVAVHLLACWFESLATATSDAFIEIGTSGSTQTVDVFIDKPYLNTHVSPGVRAKSLLKIGNGTRIHLSLPGSEFDTFDQLIEFVGTTSPDVTVETHGTHQVSWLNSGSGTPVVRMLVRNLSGGWTVTNDFTLARQSDGARRFKTALATAETGSGNTGGNWTLSAYGDDGSLIGTVVTYTRSSLAATFGGVVTAAAFNSPDNTNENMAQTFDPRYSASGAVLSANTPNYARLVKGKSGVTTLNFKVIASSGNMDAGVYRSNGSGGSAWRPSGAVVNHCGSTAVPAIGEGSVSITSTDTTAGSDAFSLEADNGTASFSRSVGVSSTQLRGISYAMSSTQFPLGTVGSLSGQGSVFFMEGT